MIRKIGENRESMLVCIRMNFCCYVFSPTIPPPCQFIWPTPKRLDETSQFPNGVPRFESKKDCLTFMKEYNTHHGGSNPEQPHLMHIFTMLTSWEQIEQTLLPGIAKARSEPSFAKQIPREYMVEEPTNNDAQNVYERQESWNVIQDINYRLNLPIHRCTTPTSTMNTLKYLFYHMKCGIFVMIRDSKLRIFAPFVNSDYRNTWGDKLTIEGDGSLSTYYSKKDGLYRDEEVEPDKMKWWANGNIICNELSKPEDRDKTQFWGDHFLAALRDMIGEACRERTLPDCEFFLNKRDYPQLKVNISRGGEPMEPYGFIFDKDDRDPEQDVDLFEAHKFKSYAPIVSFYAASPKRFSDIPWPSSEDWEAACELLFTVYILAIMNCHIPMHYLMDCLHLRSMKAGLSFLDHSFTPRTRKGMRYLAASRVICSQKQISESLNVHGMMAVSLLHSSEVGWNNGPLH